MTFVSRSLLSHLSHRSIFSSTSFLCNPGENPNILTSSPENSIMYNPHPRTRTPLEKQFETWIDKLKPGFTPEDVDDALRSQSDPDLALDIFRWTAQQRCYKHNHVTYHTMIDIALTGKRYGHAETLIEEVLAGACSGSVTLYNSMIRFCCSQKRLFNRAFDVYKKMQRLPDFRSLLKQMKASGVIPDTYALNMIIKAYSKCLQMDEAIRIFREMGLYGCEPNAFTYSYIAKGFCEKGKVTLGLGFYKEMRGKCLVPTSSTYMILICSLAMERMFEDAIHILFDMLANSMSPDLLTHKTLLGELCREGKGNEALELLEELRKKDDLMGEKTYKTLLKEVHFRSGD
ncbi:pentatricopeptide repeat-containing protein At3g25210, mitochondrial [Telopea speciosissima]|uniref:pentatricopeptide repeat-containing protein At3g25210, mitochondrial n=1 Tax=Telopea speciosissima TaxID=54955 RepID=UPI001CC4510B|nr:pentatricopeptide repeat-containing protein At3g25210, mitochondrial [Telopea speciosissima]